MVIKGTHSQTAQALEAQFSSKPAAQTAGAGPSRCNSTNRQNPSDQQNRLNFLTNNTISIFFQD